MADATVVNGQEGDELLQGRGVGDTVMGMVAGTDGPDPLMASQAQASEVLGFGGQDTLTGRLNYQDTLNGGDGDDLYIVGGSNAVIQLDAGFGRDQVATSNAGGSDAPGAFTVKLAPGFNAANAKFSLINDLQAGPSRWVLSFDGLDDQIEFIGFKSNSLPSFNFMDTPGSIRGTTPLPHLIEFGDGMVWTHNDILLKAQQAEQPGVFVAGSLGADTIVGADSGAHVYRGLGGNDTYLLGQGSAVALGGSGNDSYVLQAGWGMDTSQHIETVLYTQSTGSEFFSYTLKPGAGPVNIMDDGGRDALRFADATKAQDIRLSHRGRDVVIDHSNGRQIVLVNVIDAINQVSDRMIESLVFADGSTLDLMGWVNARLEGTVNADLLDGGVGQDTLLGMAGDDTLRGGFGDDWLEGGAGNDLLVDDGLLRVDPTLYGVEWLAAGSDTFVFNRGFGQDTVVGSRYYDKDSLRFGPDIALADLRKTELAAGEGVILSLVGTSDSVQIKYVGPGWPMLSSPIATVQLDGRAPMSYADFLSKVSIMENEPTPPLVQGTANADQLVATAAEASLVQGQGGNDTLYGRSGLRDTLNGGTDDDLYLVGSSDAVIQLNAGFGRDQVQTNPVGSQAPGAFTVKLASNYRAADAKLSLINDDQFKPSRWVLSFAGSGDQIEFQGRINSGAPSLDFMDTPSSVGSNTAMPDRIEFGDGTVWTQDDILAKARLADQPGVFVAGTSGADTLVGASVGAHVYRGLGGYDTFQLGAGNSLALGGSGNDTYVLGQGWGTDVSQHITQSFGVAYGSRYMSLKVDPGAGPMLLSDEGGSDVLKFADSTTAKDISLSYSGKDVVITHQDGRRIVMNNVLDAYHQVSNQLIESLSFADGSSLDVSGWISSKLVGTAGADLLDGDEGNDTLLGMAGNDTLKGGFGNDWLEGGAGNDLLIDNGIYQLDPVVYGGSGEPRAAGSDTFAFNAGFGQDTIVGSLMNDSDTLVFGPGIALADLRKAGLSTGSGVEISVNGTADAVQINYGSSVGPITTVKIDGLAAMSFVDFLSKVADKVVKPTDLILNGTTGKDKLMGGAGNDTLTGVAGNDTLVGGLGNDRLIGGKGNDTYVFKRGDGQDVIVENDSTWFNSDVLRVSDATSRQLWLSRSGNNLNISVIGTTDKVTVQDWFKSSANRVEKITASDGKSLSASKVNALVSAMAKFTAPAEGVSTLPASTQAGLTKILASSWV
jgi:Ca2+-binding RTX toxin-like protein